MADYEKYGGPAAQEVDYIYDTQNRWIGKVLDPDGDLGDALVERTAFVYDSNQIVLQFDGTGSDPLTASNLSRRYLWQPDVVDQLIADEQITDVKEPGDVLWALTDNQGTVRDLAVYDSESDVTTIANHRVYSSFGELQSQTDAAVDILFGYTGLPFDNGSGTYRTPTRSYDPATGRWTQPDWIKELGGQTNLYAYCANSPTNATDPTGMAGTPAQEAIKDISTNRQQYRDKIAKMVVAMLKNHWSPPKELGKPTRQQLETVGRIIADTYIDAVIDFLKSHSGAKPALGQRWPGQSAETHPWCADWALAIEDALKTATRTIDVMIGTSQVKLCQVVTCEYAQHHVFNWNFAPWRDDVYEHNFAICYPTGYKKLPVDASKFPQFGGSTRDLKPYIKKPFRNPGILIFDPWPDIRPRVYSGVDQNYNITNRGMLRDEFRKDPWEPPVLR